MLGPKTGSRAKVDIGTKGCSGPMNSEDSNNSANKTLIFEQLVSKPFLPRTSTQAGLSQWATSSNVL